MGWQDAPVVGGETAAGSWQSAPIVSSTPDDIAASMMQRQRQSAANVGGGLVRGAGSIGATLIRPFESGEENVQRRQAMDEALRSLIGAQPESGEFKAARTGAEILGTLGVGPSLGFAASKLSPALGAAITAGGIGGTGAGGLTGPAGYGMRVLGGTVTGGAAGGAVNPMDAEVAALIGAAIPAVGRPITQAGGAAYRTLVEPMIDPAKIAANKLLTSLGGRGDEAVNALMATQGMQTTPGFAPTMGERLAERGALTTTLAALERRLASATPETNRMVYDQTQQRIGALQAQLNRINSNIERQANMLQPAAREEMEAMRTQLLQSIENETAAANAAKTALERQGQQVAEGLPSTGQLAPGEELASRAKALSEGLRKTTVQPAYTAAFKAAGNTKIDVQPVLAEAERILGRPLTEFAPETAPDVARLLRKLTPATPSPSKLAADLGISVGNARTMLRSGEYKPQATATLQDLDALRRAINSDMTRAVRGQSPLDPTTAGNLSKLHSAIDEAVSGSTTLSQEAKDLYGAALSSYRTQYAPRFKSGETARLLKPTLYGETRIMPEDAVGKFLSDETAARQFVTTFGKDPQAAQAMSTGIQDLFRSKVVDPVTRMVKPDAAAKFLQDNARQLNMLEQSGVNVRQALQQVQADAQRIAAGIKNLNQAAPFAGKGSATELVDYMLQNTSNMRSGMARLDASGRAALASEVGDRANSLLKQGNADAALKFLTGNKETAQMAMGGSAYTDLLNLAKLSKETATVAASMPKGVEGRLPTMLQGYSAKDLMNLELVARDVKRMQQVEQMATFGAKTTAPRAGALATEEAATGPVTPQKIQFLSRVASVVKNVFSSLEEKVNHKVAAELGTLMYRDPDAAVKLIRDAQLRAAKSKGPASAATQMLRGGAVAASNALAPQPESVNALAP